MRMPRKESAFSGGLLLAFISECASGRYRGRVVNCNTGAVSKFKMKIRRRYYSSGAVRM